MDLNSDSRTQNAGKNVASALANKLAALFLTFVSRKFFIQYIGVEYLGINGLFSNVLTLLSMADMGLSTAMNVSLYKPITDRNTKKLSALLDYYRQLYYLIAAAVTIIGIGIIPFLKYIVNLDSNIPHLYLYYVIFVLKNTFSYLFVYKQSIIIADQKNYLVNKIDLYINAIRVVAQIVVIIVFKNYLIYILIELTAVICHNLIISQIANRQYSFLKNREQLTTEEKKILFADMYSAFLYKVAGSIQGGTDNILISMIVGTVAVGMYSNYYTIANNLQSLIILIFTSLTASVGNLVATSAPKERFATFRVMQMVANWIGAFVTVCLFYLTQNFIVLWLDESMLMDRYVLIAIVANMYYNICMRPVWTFREGTGMYRQIRYITLATAVINLFLSIGLGKIMGVGGILLATFIAKLITSYCYEPVLLYKNFFRMKPIEYYWKNLENVLLTLFCGIICYIPVTRIISGSVWGWISKAMICALVVNVVFYIRYKKSLEFAIMLQKIQQLFNNRR